MLVGAAGIQALSKNPLHDGVPGSITGTEVPPICSLDPARSGGLTAVLGTSQSSGLAMLTMGSASKFFRAVFR